MYVYITTYVPKIGGSIPDDFLPINPIRTRPSPVRFEGVVVLGSSFFCVEACVFEPERNRGGCKFVEWLKSSKLG